MKLIFKFIIVFLSVVLVRIANADNEDLSRIIKPTITRFMRQQAVPGVAVVVYLHGHIYNYNFGVSNLRRKTPVTGRTIFELGSITKTFTGLVLAENVIRGQIHLNDKISQYLPNNRFYNGSIRQVNFVELATHTSSLPFNAPKIPYNAKDTFVMKMRLDRFLQTWHAAWVPGTEAMYSNLGFGLLGLALGNYHHRDIAELINKNILIPLHMYESGLRINKLDQKYYAQGYTAVGRPATSPQDGLLGGSWAMKSSADDMEHYLKAALLTADTPLSVRSAMRFAQTRYVKMLENTKYDTGLAWVINPFNRFKYQDLLHKENDGPHIRSGLASERIYGAQFDPDALIDKTGATDGFRSYIGVIPNKKEGVVILINRFISNRWALLNVSRKILFDMSNLNNR